MLDSIYLIGGLITIVLSANFLIDGASSIAKKFHISDLVIGLTIIALGTSAPELTINIFSSLNGSSDLAIGNILGSNIANILLILGVTSIIIPLGVQKNTQRIEIPLTLLAIVSMGVLANDRFFNNDSADIISRSDGIILLLFFSIFMYYMVHMSLNGEEEPVQEEIKLLPLPKSIFFVLGGFIGLFLGGKYMVEGAVGIAKTFGMSESVIGLTIVAIGTSLPELAASIAAAMKKNADMAIGNVVGSNLFNVFLILGISSTIHPIPLNPSSNLDIFVAGLASVFLFLSTLIFGNRKIVRLEGILFLTTYVLYLLYRILM
ncbi:MAG: calcium/sodium antiporter [Leptospiraceae bacterium]|nr:calcium/sodium antiporter [Leptospiraceae bacterium]